MSSIILAINRPDNCFQTVQEENGCHFQFLTFEKRAPPPSLTFEGGNEEVPVRTACPFDAPNQRVCHEEYQYLTLIRDIVEHGALS